MLCRAQVDQSTEIKCTFVMRMHLLSKCRAAVVVVERLHIFGKGRPKLAPPPPPPAPGLKLLRRHPPGQALNCPAAGTNTMESFRTRILFTTALSSSTSLSYSRLSLHLGQTVSDSRLTGSMLTTKST